MATAEEITKKIRELLSSQQVAVLSTYGNGQPYASLIAFTASDDLKEILFATTRASHKYRNLSGCRNAAILVDNRSNSNADFHIAVAVTATCDVEEMAEGDREKCLTMYCKKYPHLLNFASSPSTSIFRGKVREYYFVSRFQQVERLSMT